MERITRHDEVAAAAAGRIGLALLASAALHVLVIGRVEVGTPRQADAQVSIRARLDVHSSPAARPAARVQAPGQSSPVAAAIPADLPPVIEQPAAGAQIDYDIPARSSLEADAQPQPIKAPVDPVYYAARELDVYPGLMEPLRAGPALAATTQARVRVLALVDDTGAVTQADVFDSEPAGIFDDAALEALRAARFSPARKDGRAVRSRVLIELDFEDEKLERTPEDTMEKQDKAVERQSQ
jgi:protein TonB